MTGLYNWSRNVPPPGSPDHNVGYVTRLGDNSHPRKDPEFTLPANQARSNSEPPAALSEPFGSAVYFPGDYHLRPHEWSYLMSKVNFETSEFPTETESSRNVSAVSIPTTIVRGVDTSLRSQLQRQREFMNRIGSNKWYHPLSSNDVSAYGNAYVRSMNCGPFSKTQLLVSRK